MINPLNLTRSFAALGAAVVPHPQAPPHAAPSVARPPAQSAYVAGTYALASGYRTREQADIHGLHAETVLRQSRGIGGTLAAIGVFAGAVYLAKKKA